VSLLDLMVPDAPAPRALLTVAALDAVLTAQIVVAWAGEAGEEPRMRWWRSDLASEFGGEDLFKRLLPQTWPWAVLQAVRESARRRDSELRGATASPDELITLFHFGFSVDERLDDRLAALKATGQPLVALPGLQHVLAAGWSRQTFADWLAGHGEADHRPAATGRRLVGAMPKGIDLLAAKLLAGLLPLSNNYPMPHFAKER
jgi:hypothetical protein